MWLCTTVRKPPESAGRKAAGEKLQCAGEIGAQKLVDHAGVRTSSATASRYLVELPIRVEGTEATVLTNLNDRSTMRFPFLVGRNFLRNRFVVAASWAWSYLTYQRGARLITGEDDAAAKSGKALSSAK